MIEQADIITKDVNLAMTDGHNPRNQVAAGYKRSSEEGGERRNSGYRRRDDPGGDRSRNLDPSPEDILNGPCHIHYTYLDGKRVSNHLMREIAGRS
jgi:hypothetical protein